MWFRRVVPERRSLRPRQEFVDRDQWNGNQPRGTHRDAARKRKSPDHGWLCAPRSRDDRDGRDLRSDGRLAHVRISRSGVEADVLESNLSAGKDFPVVGPRDDDLPELLGGALVDRLGDDLASAPPVWAEEVRDVVDAYRELAAIENRRRRPHAGRTLDRGGVCTAVDDAPWRVLIRTELDPGDHSVRSDRLERHAERGEECARMIQRGELPAQAFLTAGTKRLTNSSALSATSRQPLSIVSAWPRPGISAISVTPSLCF